MRDKTYDGQRLGDSIRVVEGTDPHTNAAHTQAIQDHHDLLTELMRKYASEFGFTAANMRAMSGGTDKD